MSFQIHKEGRFPIATPPDFTQVDDETIIGSSYRLADDGRREERYQVLTVRDGKIVDMQGCATRRQAERFARRKAA